MENLTIGVQLIAQERQKQIANYGFTGKHHAEHPEFYENGQLEYAAMALLSVDYKKEYALKDAPFNWSDTWFKDLLERSVKDRLRIAAALLAAELDRLNEIEQL